jgi:hypothetical protein
MKPIIPNYFQKPPSPQLFPRRREMKEFIKNEEDTWPFEESTSIRKPPTQSIVFKTPLAETQPESEQSKSIVMSLIKESLTILFENCLKNSCSND